jgi:hypothetical protein
MPEEFDAIAFLTGDQPQGEWDGKPEQEEVGAGEVGAPPAEAGDGEGAAAAPGEEPPKEEEQPPAKGMSAEELAKGYEELKGAWEKNYPVLELLDRATQATPENVELADRSARQLIQAVAQARGLSPEQVIGVLFKGEAAPENGDTGGKENKFVAPKMPKPYDEMTQGDMETWLAERDDAVMAHMEKQSQAKLAPLTQEVEQKQQANEFAKKVNAAYPSVSAAITEESGGLKLTMQNVAEAMRAYPALSPLDATQLKFRKEIAEHGKKASGPKGGKPAPESPAGGVRKEVGAASFETDPVAAAMQHLTGGSSG